MLCLRDASSFPEGRAEDKTNKQKHKVILAQVCKRYGLGIVLITGFLPGDCPERTLHLVTLHIHTSHRSNECLQALGSRNEHQAGFPVFACHPVIPAHKVTRKPLLPLQSHREQSWRKLGNHRVKCRHCPRPW